MLAPSINRRIVVTISLGLLGLFLLGLNFQAWGKSPEVPGSAASWTALLPHPLEEDKLLAASRNSIYETSAMARDSWKKWATLPSSGLEIQKLRFFPQISEMIFALTGNSLYKTSLLNSKQSFVYALPRSQDQITDFTVHPEQSSRWFLGTTSGVLESQDSGAHWRPLLSAGNEQVCFLRFEAGRLFLARTHQLLVSENLSRFETAFSFASPPETESFSEEALEISETEESESSKISCGLSEMTANKDGSALWLAGRRGILESKDLGKSWKPLGGAGLANRDLAYLIYHAQTEKLFAATPYEIFEFSLQKASWKKISLSLAGEKIRGLSVQKNQLTVITTSNFLTHVILPDQITLPHAPEIEGALKDLFQDLIRLEPSAVQIQRVAARYANTENAKIKRWHAQSRLSALLPSVSFKKDFSWGNNIDLDRRSTNDPDVFIEGPADTSRGWDFGVSWDLADFIFSTSQTSIDSREKLMVELRRDLTAEATRLYYERRRLQAETLFIPSISEQEHLDRLIRIEEITALIDSLTQGFMSQQLAHLYAEHPELNALWEYQQSADSAQQKVTL